MLGAPDLKIVLQVGSRRSGAEGENHLPQLAGHASFNEAQDTVAFFAIVFHAVHIRKPAKTLLTSLFQSKSQI